MCSILQDDAKLFSNMVVPIYTPTGSIVAGFMASVSSSAWYY